MNFNETLANIKAVYRYYGERQSLQRQSGKQIYSAVESCGKNTNCFTRDGEFMGAAGRSGPCGSQKDHHRVYLCEDCNRKRQGR